MRLRELRRWRVRLEVTQEDLAKRAGVRQATVSAVERGKVKPHGVTLRAICRALTEIEDEKKGRRTP